MSELDKFRAVREKAKVDVFKGISPDSMWRVCIMGGHDPSIGATVIDLDSVKRLVENFILIRLDTYSTCRTMDDYSKTGVVFITNWMKLEEVK